ncbi:MAG: hypothetical protein ABR998_03525 [Gemmatimonadales bacterium]|jgi:hypothetical protein
MEDWAALLVMVAISWPFVLGFFILVGLVAAVRATLQRRGITVHMPHRPGALTSVTPR